MKRAATILMASLVGACGSTKPAATPEPIVQVHTVAYPVAQSCVPETVVARPDYPDTRQAIAAAPEPADVEKILYAGIKVRDRYIADLETIVSDCRNAPALQKR